MFPFLRTKILYAFLTYSIRACDPPPLHLIRTALVILMTVSEVCTYIHVSIYRKLCRKISGKNETIFQRTP